MLMNAAIASLSMPILNSSCSASGSGMSVASAPSVADVGVDSAFALCSVGIVLTAEKPSLPECFSQSYQLPPPTADFQTMDQQARPVAAYILQASSDSDRPSGGAMPSDDIPMSRVNHFRSFRLRHQLGYRCILRPAMPS